MKTSDFIKELKEHLPAIDTLRAYLYKDKIEVIDYTESFELDGIKEEPFYGRVLTIYIEDNKVSVIKNHSFELITPANVEMLKYILSILGVELEDYENHNFNPDISDLSNFIQYS